MDDKRKQKFRRIHELEGWGLNTPEMLVCHEGGDSPNTPAEIREWLSKREVANIRTYRIKGEGFNNPHLLQEPVSVLLDAIPHLMEQGLVLMVEDFSNKHTIYNGTIVLRGGSSSFEMDYCVGRRKTVRNADKFLRGDFDDLYEPNSRLPREFREVVQLSACFCPIKPVLLEWSWSVIPQGKRKENAIFWEYRSPDKGWGI